MSQVLYWPCKKCGKELNDIQCRTTTKYCKACKVIAEKEKAHRAYVKRKKTHHTSKKENLVYLLKTNGMASEGEILAFTGFTKCSLKQIIYQIRKDGHPVRKQRNGFYYYGEMK